MTALIIIATTIAIIAFFAGCYVGARLNRLMNAADRASVYKD